MSGKDLQLNLIAKTGSGTDAAFRKIRKGLADLSKHAQASAVALSKLGMKDAASTMSHLSQSINGTTKAFAAGEKGTAKYTSTLSKSEKTMSEYEKALEKTGVTIGNHKKAVKELGNIYKTTDERSKGWITTLGKVEAAGVGLAQQYRGQTVELKKGKRYAALYARELNTSAITQQVLSENIKITNGKFKILNKEGLSAFSGLTEKSARSLGMLDKSFGKLNASVNDTAAWKEAKRNYSGNAKAVDILNGRLREGTITTQQATKVLNHQTKQLGLAEQQTSKLGKGLSYLGNKFKSFAAYALAAATTAATLGTVLKTFTTNINYSQALKDLQAITSSTTTELARMDEMIRQVAGTTKFSAGEIAAGMKMLGQSGFSATESIEAIEAIANLATGTLSSMATSVEIVTTALRVFHKDASEAALVTDIFTNAVNNSKLTIDKIKTALNYLGPIAESAGMSLEDTTASLMVLSNAGIRASSMATGLRRVIKELISPSEKMTTAFREAGYSADDFNPKMNSMQTVIRRLGKVVKTTDDSFRLFGLRGATTASALVSQGVPAYEKMHNAVNRQGTAAKNAAIQLEGLGIKYKQIKDKAANLALALGDAGLTGALSLFADAVRGTLDGLTAMVATPVVGFIVKLTGAIGALIALEFAVSMVASTKAITSLGKAAVVAAAKIKTFNAALLTNPYVLAAAAILALVFAYTKLHKTTDELIVKKGKEREEAAKNADSLSQEIANVEKFNGTAGEKLKLLDKLTSTYPKYATELYNTQGDAEELLKVLKELQILEEQKKFVTSMEELSLYGKKLEELGNKVEVASEALDEFHNSESDTENFKKWSKAEQDFNKVIGNIISSINELNDAGSHVTVEDFLPVDEFGQVIDGYKEYAKQIRIALKAREDFKNKAGSGNGTKDEFKTEIELQKEKIKTKKIEERSAEISRIRISNELLAAKESLAIAKENENWEEGLFYAKKKVEEVQKRYNIAQEESVAAGKAVTELELGLLDIKIKQSNLDLKMAKFDGNKKEIEIAKENKAYHDRLKSIVDMARERTELGIKDVENNKLINEQKEKAEATHVEHLSKINYKYSQEYLDLEKRIKKAKEAIDFDSEKKVREGIISRLEDKKKQGILELKAEEERLDELTALEGDHQDEIAVIVGKIEKTKEGIYKNEKKLIKKRTEIVVDSHKTSLDKINELEKQAFVDLENNYKRGLLSEERYEKAKVNIRNEYSVYRLNEAQKQVDDIVAIGEVSEELQYSSIKELDAEKEKIYQREVARALEIRAEHKRTARDSEENIKKEGKLREEEDKKHKRMVSSMSNFISGMYTGAAKSLADVSAKAVDMAGKGNVYFDNVAKSTRASSDELTIWEGKLSNAERQVSSFEKASIFAWGGWSSMYQDLARKWKASIAATKEKIRFTKDMNRLQNTEISDLSDITSIQTKLNGLKSEYNYLGKEDLKNLYEAKKALQEQINDQRLLNAEKEDKKLTDLTAKLEEARASGVDISNYGFDKESANRIDVIEKERAALDAKVAKQEYLDAVALQALESRGATEEEISAAKEESEARIAEMNSPDKLLELELNSLTSQLDIEKLNLQVINDLKIKQYEEEVLREEELHQKRLDDIEKENAAKMLALKATDPVQDSTLDPNVAPDGLKATSNIRYFATGGQIPGESKIDSVPILARPGEWFIRNESAQHWTKNFGAGFMDGINKPLSAAGRGISSALSKVGNAVFPEVVQAPKVAFASGGQVRSSRKEDSSLSYEIARLVSAMENQNRSANSDTAQPSKNITVTLKSDKSKVSGQYDERGAQELFKLLKEQQMVVG